MHSSAWSRRAWHGVARRSASRSEQRLYLSQCPLALLPPRDLPGAGPGSPSEAPKGPKGTADEGANEEDAWREALFARIDPARVYARMSRDVGARSKKPRVFVIAMEAVWKCKFVAGKSVVGTRLLWLCRFRVRGGARNARHALYGAECAGSYSELDSYSRGG